ncbi:MAG: hypothetical protein LH606_16585 [Cytophagaceae bacterium]|nr:hypothetical protein [Cytophagaceae bacterium]
MIIETRTCHCCKSSNIVRNGKNSFGHQRYKCKDCGVTRVLDRVQASRILDSEEVTQTYKERNSFRSTARIFKISHTTVRNWLKKSPKFSEFQIYHST